MSTFTVRPEGIIRQPALTMPGNATGSEAACTSLNASSIRTLLSLSTVSDVTFDIVRATTSVQTPLVNNASAALTLGNSTYGVTVPGPALFTSNSGVTATPVSSSSNGGFTASGWNYASFTATGASGAGGAFVANAGANQGIFTTYGDGGSMFGVTRTNKTVVVDYTGTGLLLGSVNGSTQIASNNVVRLTLDTAGAATFSGSLSATSPINVTHATQPTINLLQTGQVAGSDGMAILTSGNNGYIYNRENGNLYLGTNNTERMTISGSGLFTIAGDVGITGTATVPVTVNGSDGAGNGINLVVNNSSASAGSRAAGVRFRIASTDYGGIGGSDIVNAGYGISSTGILIGPGSGRTSDSVMIRTGAAALGGTADGSQFEVNSSGNTICRGDISMSKTSAQGYIRAYATDGVKNIAQYHDATRGWLVTSSGLLNLSAATASVIVFTSGTASTFDVYDSSGGKYARLTHNGTNGVVSTSSGQLQLSGATTIALSPAIGITGCFVSGLQSTFEVYSSNVSNKTVITHDATNGIVSTSAGNLNLVPAGGTVAVTGGITASGVVSHGAYTVATLPAAGSNAGKMAQVTDSNVAASGNYGATVAAGGSNRVKVFSDGTNWVIA